MEEDYIEEKTFESSKLVARQTNRFKPAVTPSVFNFSSYNVWLPNNSDNSGTGAWVCCGQLGKGEDR